MLDLNGVVCYKNQKFYTTSIVNQHYIFTRAALTKETSSYSEMVSPDQIDTMIKDKLNVLTGLKMTGIKQKKSKTGAPSYYNKTTLLTSSCSISHHGKYGAYSFVKA
jgi:hypothetical protein